MNKSLLILLIFIIIGILIERKVITDHNYLIILLFVNLYTVQHAFTLLKSKKNTKPLK